MGTHTNDTDRATEVINMTGRENNDISEMYKTVISIGKHNWKQSSPQIGYWSFVPSPSLVSCEIWGQWHMVFQMNCQKYQWINKIVL